MSIPIRITANKADSKSMNAVNATRCTAAFPVICSRLQLRLFVTGSPTCSATFALKAIAAQLQQRQRGQVHQASFWLALRAGVLRRAVSHTARPMLRFATSSVTVGRSICTALASFADPTLRQLKCKTFISYRNLATEPRAAA